MFYRNNEKGYALVVVLLTISIIFSISAVLTSKTITSAKQISYTNDYIRLIDLAEMGATYAKVDIEKTLKESIANRLDDTSIIEDIDGDGTTTDLEKENYLNEIIISASKDVEDKVSTTRNVLDSNKYQVEVNTLEANKSKVIFGVNSTGNDGNESYPVQYEIIATITLGDVSTEIGPVSCDTDSTKVSLDDSNYDEPSDFSTSRNTITQGGLDYTTPTENNLGTQTIDKCVNYSPLTVGNGEKVDFNGSVQVYGSGADFKQGSSVTVNGNFFSQNNVTFNQSSTGIFRDFASMMKLDMKNGSTVMVDDNLDIYDSLSMDKDSYLVVTKSLLAQNFQSNSDYKVEVGGNFLATSNFDAYGDITVHEDVVASNAKIKNGNMLVGGDFDGKLGVEGGTITVNHDLNVSELNMNKGNFIVYGDFNPTGNFNFNGGYGVVYGKIKDTSKIQSNKLETFDDPNKSDFKEGYIYQYVGDPILPPELPEITEVPSSNGSTGVGAIDENTQISFDQDNVKYRP